jgi:hypothetical protein
VHTSLKCTFTFTFTFTFAPRSKDKVSQSVLTRDTVVFKPELWVKMGLFIEEHSILPSTEALVLVSRAVYIVSKTKYRATDTLQLMGRVQFLNRKGVPDVPGETGLSIYVRPIKYMDYDHLVGIRVFIGNDGRLEVSGSNLPDKYKSIKKESGGITASSVNCFRFSVTDRGDEIVLRVNVLNECQTLASVDPDKEIHAELRVKVPRDFGNDENPFVLKLEDSKRTGVIDELSIKTV